MSLLNVRELTVAYGDEPAVRDVSLDIEPGQVLGLAGESGSGKSTIGQSVLRLLPRNASVRGRIVFRGEDLTRVTWGRIRAVRWAGASVVFQGALSALNPVRTIGAQLAEPVRVHGSGLPVAELLESVGVPARRAGCYPHELSGGQRQRVLIAMALACRPHLVIADEPTTALDTIVRAQIMSLLTAVIRESGAGMLMISHDLAVLSEVCDDLAVMRDGRIVETGPADAVLLAPSHDYTRTLVAAFPRLGDPRSRLGSASASTSRSLAPVLEAREARVAFGAVRAVDGVNLTVGEREIVALIGESGCGKSTLARVLTGLVRPDAGDVSYRGEPLRYGAAALKRHRAHVQLIGQDPGGALDPRRTVFDAVAEGPRIHGMRQGLSRRVYTALYHAGLRPPQRFANRYPRELSGGQQQRVVIAGALALNPEVIVADEPTSSLDASVRAHILRLIAELRDTLGLSALIVSHDLGLAWTIADRVAVMYLGRIVESGPAEEVLEYPRHPYTRALLAAAGGPLAAAGGTLAGPSGGAGLGVAGPSGGVAGGGARLGGAAGPRGGVAGAVAGPGGEPPDPSSVPPGCRFHPRCPRRAEVCETVPLPVLAADGVACHLAGWPSGETFLS